MLTLASIKEAIENTLDNELPKESSLVPKLVEAIRYAALCGGKRIRSSLLCAVGVSLGARLEQCLPGAVAVECIHAYSLVHDDLPSLDDDDWRRGRLSCHKAFGESIAILVGDALQTLAFDILSRSNKLSDRQKIFSVQSLAHAAGWHHMIGGQVLDLDSKANTTRTVQELEIMHSAKTGALFCASVELGLIAAGYMDRRDTKFQNISKFGKSLGLAFQIVDDILDATQPTEVLGKPAGSDDRLGKRTVVHILGMNQARSRVKQLSEQSRSLLVLEKISDALVAEFVDLVADRVN